MKTHYGKTAIALAFMTSLVVAVTCVQAASTATITFMGAVVAPTCNSSAQVLGTESQGMQSCGSSSAQVTGEHTTAVEQLDSSPLAQDHMMTYFANYVMIAGAKPQTVKLVTYTYQ